MARVRGAGRMSMIAVSLFDFTGNMLKPWLEAGYECHIFDIQHPSDYRREDGMYCHKINLKSSLAVKKVQFAVARADFLSCFPPCTHLAVSGARWFKGKGLRALEESIAFFATSAEVADRLGCPYIIENPMSTISTYWREPDYKFHPCHYSGYVAGDENYTKETWLWTGNGFVMPARNMAGDLFELPDMTYIHHQPPGKERANIRSATPMGFSRAVFEANHACTACRGTGHVCCGGKAGYFECCQSAVQCGCKAVGE